MFNILKESLKEREDIEEVKFLHEMVEESESDEDMEKAIEEEDLTQEDETECEEILKHVPEYEREKENITKKEMDKADREIPEPSIKELAESLFNF